MSKYQEFVGFDLDTDVSSSEESARVQNNNMWIVRCFFPKAISWGIAFRFGFLLQGVRECLAARTASGSEVLQGVRRFIHGRGKYGAPVRNMLGRVQRESQKRATEPKLERGCGAQIQPGVSLLEFNAAALLRQAVSRLRWLGRSRYYSMRRMAHKFRKFPERHGTETGKDVAGPYKQRIGVLRGELSVGYTDTAVQQPAIKCASGVGWGSLHADAVSDRVGRVYLVYNEKPQARAFYGADGDRDSIMESEVWLHASLCT